MVKISSINNSLEISLAQASAQDKQPPIFAPRSTTGGRSHQKPAPGQKGTIRM